MTARPVALSHGWRVLRALLLATSAAGLSIAGHGAAGGDLPDTTLSVLTCLALGWAVTTVADRRHSRGAILAALGGSQLALHLVLSPQHSAPAHHHHSSGVPAVVTPVMLAAHTLAAVLTGLLLATADTALIAAATALAMVLPRRPLRLTACTPLWIVVPVDAETDPAGDLLFTRICARRGPPT